MKKALIFLSLSAFLLAPHLSSQAGKGRIRGLVLDDQSGQPLAGVTVKMYSERTAQYLQPSPVTDREGRWLANFLQVGMWTLSFELVGFAPQQISFRVGFDPEAQKEVLTVRLRKIQGVLASEDILGEAKKADKLFQEKKYEESLAILEKIIKNHPELYVLFKNIGVCYFAMEDYEKALGAFMKVYEKQPDRPDILADIANTYNNWGKKEEAAEWYKDIPLEEIRDIDTAYNAGVVFYNAGSPADALKYFKKAVEIDNEFADGYYQLGMASVATNNNADAIAAFQKVLELAPDTPQAATAKSIVEALTKK
jgi:tetratricopeptide (TPR) repeat protein